MKLFYDDNFNNLDYEVEMNESTGSKNYVIKGVFSTPEMRNRNGRIYSKQLWETNVQNYQQEIQNNTDNTLMEAEHPPRSSVDKWKAVAKIRKLEMKPDGKVYGEAVILNNNSPESNQIKALIDAGSKIGVSSRGVGKLGKGNIVEEFKLITYDIVSSPSDYNASMNGFNESMILENVDFKITEDGRVICDESGCRLEENNQETVCNSKAQELLEALQAFTKKEEPSKYSHLSQDKIEKLFEMGLIEASEYAKLKKEEPSEEEKEKEKEQFRKDNAEKDKNGEDGEDGEKSDNPKDSQGDEKDSENNQEPQKDSDGDDTTININVDNDDQDDKDTEDSKDSKDSKDSEKKKKVTESTPNLKKDKANFNKYVSQVDDLLNWKIGPIITRYSYEYKPNNMKPLQEFQKKTNEMITLLADFDNKYLK